MSGTATKLLVIGGGVALAAAFVHAASSGNALAQPGAVSNWKRVTAITAGKTYAIEVAGLTDPMMQAIYIGNLGDVANGPVNTVTPPDAPAASLSGMGWPGTTAAGALRATFVAGVSTDYLGSGTLWELQT